VALKLNQSNLQGK